MDVGDATIFQDIYSTTTLQIENRKQQLSKHYIYTYFYSKRTATPNIFINWMNSGLNPNLDCENFRNSHVSNLSNFYTQIKHLYSPPRFSMVFQIWSPWCFFSNFASSQDFLKTVKCFFQIKKMHVKLGGHFPSKSSQNIFTLQTPHFQVEGRLVQAQVKEKTKSGTSNSIKADFPAEQIPEKQWGWCHLLPSWELTYPPKKAFWRWFSFSQGGIC